MLQLLTPEGRRVDDPDLPLHLTDDQYRAFYRDLVLVRRFDDEATALQRQGELGLWAPLRGQEAAQVGSGRALRPEDMAFPTYREHGVALCRGVDPVDILGLFRGTTLGGWSPEATGLALYTIVVGAQALHAVGYAMAIQQEQRQQEQCQLTSSSPVVAAPPAVLAYFGDGASSQGDVLESFVWAKSFDAPVVFFCTNNQFAISVPAARQLGAPLTARAEGFGIPATAVDGNDVLAVHAATTAALERARRGEGPQLIEAHTYRMGPHTTSDDPSRYRDPAELAAWEARDPLLRLRRYLEGQGLADEGFLGEVDAAAETLAAQVRAGCRAIPDPLPGAMFDHVYATEPPSLTEQRQWHEQYLTSFEDAPGSGGAR
ncbi:MAG: 2-oxoisovalerate dehydrogenase component alpha subunit [Frankiaceae bacterium]|nr:2-oxoisovalerate dehydrogenase component alpha subunit [Frankiaceae bacterium]